MAARSQTASGRRARAVHRRLGAVGAATLLLVAVTSSCSSSHGKSAAANPVHGSVSVSGCRASARQVAVTATRLRLTTSSATTTAASSTTTTSSSTTSTSTTSSTSTTTSSTTVVATTAPAITVPTTSPTTVVTTTPTTVPGGPVLVPPTDSMAGRGAARSTLAAGSVASGAEVGGVVRSTDMTGPTIKGKVSGSGSHLTFKIPGAKAGTPYVLQVTPGGTCTGAHVGFTGAASATGVVIGGLGPIHVAVAKSTLEGDTVLQVYAGTSGYESTPDGANSFFDNWADHDDTIAWGSANSEKRLMRWTSTAPGTTGGTWEAATVPFPAGCASPAEVFASGDAPFKEGTFPTRPNGFPAFTLDLPAIATAADVATHPQGPGTVLYIRVVPHGDGGKACTGNPSNSVALRGVAPTGHPWLPDHTPADPPAVAPVSVHIDSYQPLSLGTETPKTYCFVALADHDVATSTDGSNSIGGSGAPSGDADVVGAMAMGFGHGPHFTKGERFCVTSQDSEPSWLEQAASFVSDAVSFPAKVWDVYVAIVPAILGEVLTELGIPCSSGGAVSGGSKEPPSKCFTALLTAEKIGLAALGVPPSLPDASKFVDEGEDYMVGVIAEESGIDPAVARKAYDQAKDQMVAKLAAASTQSSGWACSWCVYDQGVHAPSANVTVTRAADTAADLPSPNRLCLRNANPPGTVVYQAQCVSLPPLKPGAHVTVPFRLVPAYTPELDAQHEKDRSDCASGKVSHPSFYATCTDLADAFEFQGWQGTLFAKVPEVRFLAETMESYLQYPSSGATGTVVAGKGSDYQLFPTR